MNKTELIAAVAEKADLSKKDAEAAITATVDAIAEALTRMDNFLTNLRKKQAREG